MPKNLLLIIFAFTVIISAEGQNLIVREHVFRWNSNSQQWENYFQTNYEYNSSIRLTYREGLLWNPDKRNWEFNYWERKKWSGQNILLKNEYTTYLDGRIKFNAIEEHDEKGRWIYYYSIFKRPDGSTIQERTRVAYDDANNGYRFVREYFDDFTKTWDQEYESIHYLDDKGCEVEVRATSIYSNPVRLTYTRGGNCEFLSLLREEWDPVRVQWVPVEWDKGCNSDSTGLVETCQTMQWDGEEWGIKYQSISHFNERRLVTEYYYEEISGYREQCSYLYDNTGERIESRCETRQDSSSGWLPAYYSVVDPITNTQIDSSKWNETLKRWERIWRFQNQSEGDRLRKWNSYESEFIDGEWIEIIASGEYHYDEKGRVTKDLSENWHSHDPAQTYSNLDEFSYVDDCDGLTAQKIHIHNQELYEKTIYTYLNGSYCAETSNPSLHLFPNPANNYIYLESDLLVSPEVSILIFDLNGRLLKEWEAYRGAFWALDISGLPAGMYVLQIGNENQSLEKKFVKL